MSQGKRDAKFLEGKTILRVDTKSVNVWFFFFTDGTSIAIDTEAKGHGIYGPVFANTEEYSPRKN